MNNSLINQISIQTGDSILSSLQLMNKVDKKLLLVFDDKKLFAGVLSIGDIQRAIIKNINLENPISTILRQEYLYATEDQSLDSIKERMLKERIECMPVINKNVLVDVVFWNDIVPIDQHCRSPFNLPVIIMAGGQGARLRPLTNVLPKPLIPIGEKTMIEDIMDKFVHCGSNNFYISVNYKADFIRNYLNNINNSNYIIQYFQEKKPLGTAGSLRLLKDKITSPFFVSNCDILIDEDYSQILKYHQENKNDLTVVVAVKSYSIPYGIVETAENGVMISLIEKPDLTFKINTGMYILEPKLLDEIPDDTFFHITHLMEKIKDNGGKVGCFPITENSWKDIGDWKEYYKHLSL